MPLDFRYRRLGYVALNVTDIERSKDFYQQIVGLDQVESPLEGEALMRCTDNHHDVSLCQANVAGLNRIGWEMESPEDLDRVIHHLTGLGIKTASVPSEVCQSLGVSAAVRMSDPLTGATFEFFHSMAAADNAFVPTVAKIERVGHLVVCTDRYEASEDHFTQKLNFRVSDRMEPAVHWMRCFPNPLHHSLGVARADKRRFHHLNFMVTDIDDIGKGLWRLKNHDVPIVFGPGRHPPSDSVFLYFLDPDQLTLEYSFGMEEFPEIDPRPPRDLELSPESVDYWGSYQSPDFAKHGEVEVLETLR